MPSTYLHADVEVSCDVQLWRPYGGQASAVPPRHAEQRGVVKQLVAYALPWQMNIDVQRRSIAGWILSPRNPRRLLCASSGKDAFVLGDVVVLL